MDCSSKSVKPQSECYLYETQKKQFQPDTNQACEKTAEKKNQKLNSLCPRGQTYDSTQRQELQSQLIDYVIEKYSSSSCKQCKKKPQFTESKYELTFTCGDKKSKACGIRLTIKLPHLENYSRIYELQKEIDQSLNYKVLQSYFEVTQPNLSKLEKQITNIQTLYETQNDIINREILLKQIMSQRKKLYREKNSENVQQYVESTTKINELYKQAVDLVTSLQRVLIVKAPTKTIKSYTNQSVPAVAHEVNQIQSKQKQEWKPKDKIKWIYRKNYKWGILQKVNPRKSVVLSGDSEYIVENSKLQLVSDSEYELNTKDIKLSLEVGMKVQWLDSEGNIQEGTVSKLTKTKVVVITSNQNEYSLSYSKLKRVVNTN